MPNQNNQEYASSSDSNSFQWLWFKDGVGVNYKTHTYSFRLSNLALNSQRMISFTAAAIAYFANGAQASPEIDWYNNHYAFQVRGTNNRFIAWIPTILCNDINATQYPFLDRLRNGACDVVPIKTTDSSFNIHCAVIHTLDEACWMLNIEPIVDGEKWDACDSLYNVSRCIADFAKQYNELTAFTVPDSDPSTLDGYPPVCPSETQLSAASILARQAGASICALGALAFFGDKIYNKCFASPSSKQLPFTIKKESWVVIEDELDHLTPHDYNCPIHLERMEDPYKLSCGHTLDLRSLNLLTKNKEGRCQCPLCREVIMEVRPNRALKEKIENEANTRFNMN